PANTLPGAFWRLYLLREWVRRDPATVEERYRAGVAGAVDETSAQADAAPIPTPDEVTAGTDALLAGRRPDDLPDLLDGAARLLRALSAGAGGSSEPTWVTHDEELAGQVTRRSGALVATAEELEGVAALARVDRLV